MLGILALGGRRRCDVARGGPQILLNPHKIGSNRANFEPQATKNLRHPVIGRLVGRSKYKCLYTPLNTTNLAEAVRFELTDGFTHRRFSRPLP